MHYIYRAHGLTLGYGSFNEYSIRIEEARLKRFDWQAQFILYVKPPLSTTVAIVVFRKFLKQFLTSFLQITFTDNTHVLIFYPH